MKNYRVFFSFWAVTGVGRASTIVLAESEEEARIKTESDLIASKAFKDTSPFVYEVREATINDLDEFEDAV